MKHHWLVIKDIGSLSTMQQTNSVHHCIPLYNWRARETAQIACVLAKDPSITYYAHPAVQLRQIWEVRGLAGWDENPFRRCRCTRSMREMASTSVGGPPICSTALHKQPTQSNMFFQTKWLHDYLIYSNIQVRGSSFPGDVNFIYKKKKRFCYELHVLSPIARKLQRG